MNRNTYVKNSRLNCRTVGLLAAGILLCSSIQFANAAPGGGSSPNSPFVELNGELVKVQFAITSLQDQINILVRRVDTVEERVTADEEAIAGLQDQNDALTLLVNDNITDIQTIKDRIDLLQQENEALLVSITANTGDIVAQHEAIADNALAISNLQQALIQVDTNAISLTDGLQEQIDHNQALIDLLQDEVVTLSDAIALKQNLIDGTCPDGTAVTEVHPDGSVSCGGAGAEIGKLQSVKVWKFANNVLPNRSREVNAVCPSGYTSVGSAWFGISGFHIYRMLPVVWGASISVINQNGYAAWIYAIASCLRIAP